MYKESCLMNPHHQFVYGCSWLSEFRLTDYLIIRRCFSTKIEHLYLIGSHFPEMFVCDAYNLARVARLPVATHFRFQFNFTYACTRG